MVATSSIVPTEIANKVAPNTIQSENDESQLKGQRKAKFGIQY